jgi:hypothetical protein
MSFAPAHSLLPSTLARIMNKPKEEGFDWLPLYMTDEGFDLPRLLNDDFVEAIKVLYNEEFYASATKLLMSFIDTLAYLEYGDGGGKYFQRWLNKYTDLKKVNATSEELWEHRNSLVHMSTLSSRKVKKGEIRRLIAYIGDLPTDCPNEDPEAKWFSLWSLIQAVALGVSRFSASFMEDTSKIRSFVDRYDGIISDKRKMHLHTQQKTGG